jgi:hypothetical protein
MVGFTRIYVSLGPLVAFSPILIAIAGGLITRGLARHRWMAHSLTLVALVALYPLYFWIEVILDPTTLPGPCGGGEMLLYVFSLVPAIVAYSAYAWLTRRGDRDIQLQSQTQG